RMNAVVRPQVDPLKRDARASVRGLQHRLCRSRQREHRSIVIGVRRHIEETDTPHPANRGGERREHVLAPPLAEVWDAFDRRESHGETPAGARSGIGRACYSSFASVTREKWITVTVSSTPIVRR